MVSEFPPKLHQRYSSLPILGSVLDEFAAWSRLRGYALSMVSYYLGKARHVDGFFRQLGVQNLGDLTHSHFDAAYSHYRQHRPKICGTIHRISQFLEETRRLALRCPPPRTPVMSEVDHFVDYLRNVRGLEPRTIEFHICYVKEFLGHLGYDLNTNVIATLAVKQVDDFLCVCAKRLNRYSLQHVVASLRAFLRFQHEQGILRSPLHTMIDTPRIYRFEQIPRALPWETVNALLHAIDRSATSGMRDYAVLFLMATYGLRNSEVVGLTLDDIDWRAGILHIPQRKTRNRLLLPLTDAVADVVIAYLESRPKLPYRELFLRIRPPHGPLGRTAVSDIFRHWLRESGLDIPLRGAHCIRHSYAVHLLRQGAPVKAIGDLLGHRSAASTCVYLRLAVEDLRSVALPVPRKRETDLDIQGANGLSGTRTRGKAPVSSHRSTPLSSFFAEEIEDYLKLKRSLGRIYRSEAIKLHALDAFLATRYPLAKDMTGEMFTQWGATLEYLSPTVRRRHLEVARNFCRYRRRLRPESFLPDSLEFPPRHPQPSPYILSESEMARVLESTRCLHMKRCPLRSETLRIAFLLLYTTGIRSGELTRLTLGDIDAGQQTLLIKASKFHKSRILPLSESVAAELKAYLRLRHKNGLPMDVTAPVVWHDYRCPKGRGYNGRRLFAIWATLCASLKILTAQGKPPRLHDMRHSFAVNALLRWYRSGEDVQAKLPLLSTYLGHVSVVSTHYYLTFIEELRCEASTRFYQHCGNVVRPNPSGEGGAL